jgi:hypothetical protein
MKLPNSDDDPLLNTADAAKHIGVHHVTLAGWRSPKSKIIGPEFITIGRKVFYRKSALDGWRDRPGSKVLSNEEAV